MDLRNRAGRPSYLPRRQRRGNSRASTAAQPGQYGGQQQPGQYGGQQPGQWGQQQYGQPYGQPYGPRYGQQGGFGQFGGYPQPPRRRGGPLRILIFGLVGLITLGIGVAVLFASLGSADEDSQPAAGGPSVVPTANGNVEPGTAEDVLVNNPIFSVGALDELDCKAEEPRQRPAARRRRSTTRSSSVA